ncbi:DUF1223 domain-containing protein [Ulvibacter sp. MAR_2010_11]|uniref:DUF1223 domain-containing protein n=1 Tax=Ulvibacter sp. MAR_2010_11 TaxID=1250229 RepID=UPI000C2C3508|nr:DUF1223 domain-containing protein [Ulvibacter sp. MAR_2010_11]
MKTHIFCSTFPVFLILMIGFSTINSEKSTVFDEKEPFVFIQLFTSQGCSSCPPADVLLEEVKNNFAKKNVLVASYHVDYWDRLGWKDPFSKSDYTTLQHAYGFKFNSRSVYTPQAVVNGSIHFVGSNKDSMNKYVSKFLKTASENAITLSEITKKK